MTSDIVDALRAYKQADADGVMVLVSRQACEVAAADIEVLRISNKEWMKRAEAAESALATATSALREADDGLEDYESALEFANKATPPRAEKALAAARQRLGGEG